MIISTAERVHQSSVGVRHNTGVTCRFAHVLGRLQRAFHSILSARLLLNLREASLHSTVVADGSAVHSASANTTSLGEMHFKAGPNRNLTSTLFTIDDGNWVSGDSSEGARFENNGAYSIEMIPFPSEGSPQLAESAP